MKYPIILTFIILACSASNSFKKDEQAFNKAKVLNSFKSIGDLNDSYFVIKEDNFFEFYKVLYDSVKNSSYPGRFTNSGDTMLLTFYNKKGYNLLAKKALISKDKKEIVFFDNFPGYKKKLLIN